MLLIGRELEASREFCFDKYDGVDLPRLSLRNVALAEAMVANNSSYMLSQSKGGVSGDGAGSDFWLDLMREFLKEGEDPSGFTYEQVVEGAVKAIDRENSTHLNADGVGREELCRRLLKLDRDALLGYLENPEETDYRLIDILSEQTNAPVRPRRNLSFASKFCHYACLAFFKGKEAQDNYPVYDNIVKGALPKYIAYFSLNRRSQAALSDYQTYRECVAEIIAHADEPISRNGFDHLVWYYFKGRQ